jgi:hypothetical protein
MKNTSIAALLFAISATLTAPVAQGWDGIASGKISQIDTVNETNNYELRVFLGDTKMCNHPEPSLNTWAYLNSSDPNYKATLANLMLAYAMGKSVVIFTMNDAGAGCHIHYVAVRG